MKVEKKQTTATLDLEELRQMIFLSEGKNLGITNASQIESIEKVETSKEVRGMDPHDCDYIKTFAGIKFVVNT